MRDTSWWVDSPASFVVFSLETGEAIAEFRSIETVQRINFDKYGVVPILDWLGSL